MRTRAYTVPSCVALLVGAFVAVLAGTGCAATPAQTEDSAETDDALSVRSIPSLQSEIDHMLSGISAAPKETYVAKANARAWLHAQVQATGVSPESATFVLRPKMFALADGVPFDHSEIDIDAILHNGKQIPLHGRILGDVWGAGLYGGKVSDSNLGPPLCVTWAELDAAVQDAYVPGGYLTTFVCHDITFRGLDAVGVSVHDYSSKIRGWKLASYAFGPIWAHTPSGPASASHAAQKCAALGIR